MQDRSFRINDLNDNCLLIAGASTPVDPQRLSEESYQKEISGLLDKIIIVFSKTLYATFTTEHQIQDFITILSEREQQVLKYMLSGLSAREIGDELFLSPRTIEDYINKIKIKLKFDVTSKSELIILCIENNIMRINF